MPVVNPKENRAGGEVRTAQQAGLGQAQARAAPAPMQSFQVSDAAFGGAQGRSLENAGNAIQRRASEIKQENDRAMAVETKQAMNKFIQEKLYDPETGALHNLRGRNALGFSEAFQKDFSEQASKLRGELKNRTQQDYFDRLVTQLQSSTFRSTATHESRERRNWMDSVQKGEMTQALNAIAANPNDQQMIQERLSLAESTIRELSEIEGKSAQETDAAVQSMYSEAHVTAINAMIDQYPERAKAYFEANKRQISAAIHADIENKLKAGTIKKVAQNKSDALAASYPGDYGAQVEAAREIEDPEERERVLRNIDNRKARDERIEAESREALVNDFATRIGNGESVNDLPVAQWLSLPDNVRNELEEYERAVNGQVPLDGMEALKEADRINEEIARNPEAILDYSSAYIRSKVHKDYQDELLDARNKALAGEAPGDVVEATIGIQNKYFKMMQQDLGMLTPDGSLRGSQSDRSAMLFESYQKELAAFEAKHERKPSREELLKIRDDLTMEVTFDGGFLPFNNKTKAGFELTGEEDLGSVVVPEDMRSEILNEYQRLYPDNQGMTEEQIKNVYLDYLRKNLNE